MEHIHVTVSLDQVKLICQDYVANGGWETFLSFQDVHADILIGLLHLWKISNVTWLPKLIAVPCSIVWELHIYGTAMLVLAHNLTHFQHQGYDILLMEEPEWIAHEEHRLHKLLVIASVDTRHYDHKLSYHLNGPYMSKLLVVMEDVDVDTEIMVETMKMALDDKQQ